MVFFTCDYCGASLKKNQVEKHYLHQCRNCSVLTCIDCQKDFPGDSYKEHIKCISEEEKYSAKGWQPKASANKGLKKQEAWIENIRAIQDERGASLDLDVRKLLDTIIGFDNIPRKRNKFVNFVQNAMGRRTPASTIDKTWEVFEEAIKRNVAQKAAENNVDKKTETNGNTAEKTSADDVPVTNNKLSGDKDKKEKKKSKKNKAEKEASNVKTENGTTEPKEEEIPMNQGVKMFAGTKAFQNGNSAEPATNGTKSDKKKRKRTGDDDDEEEEETTKKIKSEDTSAMEEDLDGEEESAGDENTPKKFNWEITIRRLLEKKGSMKVKRLKKKVVDEYVKRHGDTVKSRIQLEAKLEKKLKKNKEFKYTSDVVSLSTSR